VATISRLCVSRSFVLSFALLVTGSRDDGCDLAVGQSDTKNVSGPDLIAAPNGPAGDVQNERVATRQHMRGRQRLNRPAKLFEPTSIGPDRGLAMRYDEIRCQSGCAAPLFTYQNGGEPTNAGASFLETFPIRSEPPHQRRTQ